MASVSSQMYRLKKCKRRDFIERGLGKKLNRNSEQDLHLSYNFYTQTTLLQSEFQLFPQENHAKMHTIIEKSPPQSVSVIKSPQQSL